MVFRLSPSCWSITMNKFKPVVVIILLILLSLTCCSSIRLCFFLRSPGPFPLPIKWQMDLGHSTYERPAYQDGLVLFPANNLFDSHWYGLDAITGEVVWAQSIRRNSFRRCLTSEYLVVAGNTSFVTMKTRTGKNVWALERAATATCSETEVFAILPRGILVAIDLSGTRSLWDKTTPFKIFTGSVYNPEIQYLIASQDTFFYFVDPQTGILLGSPFEITAIPLYEGKRGITYLVDRGQLFVGGTVHNAQTGVVIHKEGFYRTNKPPTVTQDTMYLTSGSAVVAYNRDTYNIKWVYPQETGIGIPFTLSPIAILDGVGYIIYSDATLRAIDLETGQELGYWQPSLLDRWRWPVCAPLPFPFCVAPTGVGLAASEDTLFVSFGDGKLYAFGK